VALLSGCAAFTAQPASSSARVVYITSLEKIATPMPDVLSAIDASSGKLLWRFHPPNLNITTAVPGRDEVYVGATDHRVYALAKGSGQARWQALVGGFPNVEAVAGDIVLVMATSDRDSAEYNLVYALNASDGKAIWHADLQRGVVRAIAAGKVYVETGGPDEPTILTLDVRTGQRLWQYPLGGNGAQWQLLDGQIYVQTSPSRDPLTSVRFVISGSTGKLLWRFPSSGEAVIWWLRVADGHVYVEHSGGQSAGTMITAFDAASGALKWQRQAPASGSALVGAGNGSVYATTRTELVALRAADGREQWRSTVGEGVAGLALAFNEPTVVPGAIYAPIMGAGLVKFNAADGSQAWHVPMEDLSGFAIATVNHGVLYAGQLVQRQILALDTATGKLLWHYDVAESIIQVTFG
jgi:outer membrane protein assembly factor BamB